MPNLNLGTFAQNFGCEMYRGMRFLYYYSSYAYERVCEYKSHYNGFEWWTGREWSRNKELFRDILNKDSDIESLRDLYYRQKDYYKERDINE